MLVLGWAVARNEDRKPAAKKNGELRQVRHAGVEPETRPITLRMCQGLPYNSTFMPNRVGSALCPPAFSLSMPASRALCSLSLRHFNPSTSPGPALPGVADVQHSADHLCVCARCGSRRCVDTR
uniref:Uncharacterized protein n=1 Tax=Neolamprologus brichardi TaxID=32507 RepID=A0A3Q4HS71_NEOBR